KRDGSLLGQSTQHIALGDDRGIVRTQLRAGAWRGNQQRRYPLARHSLQRIGEYDIGGDGFWRRAHDVGDAMTVGIGIDARKRSFLTRTRPLDRLLPAGAVLIFQYAR